MTFKKGDKVQTEDGAPGVILFIDRDGVEAQIALERVSMKLRTDSLRPYVAADAPAVVAVKAKRTTRRVR